MTKKVSLNKLDDENTVEIGIQIRNDVSIPTQEKIETNGENLKAFTKGQNRKLNIGVYASDPTDLTADQIWVNDTDNKLRWSVQGVVSEIAMPQKEDFASVNTTEELYNLLTRIEDKTKSALPVYNSLYDTFDFNSNSTKQDVVVYDDGLVVKEGKTSGIYIKSEKQSSPANNVEGLLTFNSQAFKPLTVTNNMNGTHSVVLKGVVADLLKVGKELFVLEVRPTIINKYGDKNVGLGVGAEFGKTYNINDKKSYPMLDENLSPVIVTIDSMSHNGINTTLMLSTGVHDLTTVQDIQFLAKPMTVRAGVNGEGGTLDELQIKELFSIDKKILSTTEGVITNDIMTIFKNNTAFQKCNNIVWKHSPDKKQWIIFGQYPRLSESNRVSIWYSNNGLASVQFYDDYSFEMAGAVANDAVDNPVRIFNSIFVPFNEERIQINNDGRFCLAVQHWDSDYSRWNGSVYFGKTTGKFIFTAPAFGAVAGYRKNQIAFANSTASSYYLAGMAIDWESGLLATSASVNDDAYVLFWYLDFDTYQPDKSGVIGYRNFVTTDYRYNRQSAVMFWYTFEGERMLFCSLKHLNRNYYAIKFSRERILKEWRDTLSYGFGIPVLSIVDGLYGYAFCAVSEYEAGNRATDGAWMHEIGAGTAVDQYVITDDGTLIAYVSDEVDGFTAIGLTDFGRTGSGTQLEYDLEFDAIPDLGMHSINKVEFDIEPTSGTITIQIAGASFGTQSKAFYTPTNPLLNSAEALTKDFISSIPWLREGELEITGDAIIGFTFNWKHLPEEITLTTVTNTLVSGATPVVPTYTVLQTGVASTGGDLTLTCQLLNRDATNTKALTTTNSAVIKAGMTKEAITNVLNSTAILGANANKNIEQKHRYPQTLSRVSKKVLYANGVYNTYNTHRRFNVGAEHFNVELRVDGVFDYKLKLEIIGENGTTVLWSSDVTYSNGFHVIPADFTKFVKGSYLVASSYTENEEDYDKVQFRYDYRFNVWLQDSAGGVVVNGDWATGFKILGRTLRDVRFVVTINNLVDGSLSPVVPNALEVVQGHAPVYLKYDNDVHARLSLNDSFFWKRKKESSKKYTGNVTKVGSLINRNILRLESGNTSSFVIGDIIDFGNEGKFQKNILSIIDSTDFVVSPAHGESSDVTGVAIEVFNKATFHSRNHDGQTYRLRDDSRKSSVILGRGNAESTNTSDWRQLHSHKTGTHGIIFGTDIRYAEYAGDKDIAHIVKIPDVREFHGLMFANNSGTREELNIQPNLVARNHGATKFAQKFTVPDLGYENSSFPLRTLTLNMRRTWLTTAPWEGVRHGDTPDAYVKVSIIGLIGGFPDESNVIATSLSKVPLIDIPLNSEMSVDSTKFIPFIFDNVQLTPSSDVCIMVEVVGLDIENLPNESFLINIGANNVATGNCFGNISNVWSTVDNDMWFYFYDYYLMIPSHLHESGYNKNVNIFSRASHGQQSGALSESTLGRISGDLFYGTYQHNGYYQDTDDNLYSSFRGGVKSYGFIVDNENIASPYHPPIIKDPRFLGVEDESTVDKNLVWAHAFGYTPDGRKGLYLDGNGKPEVYTDNGFNGNDGDNDNYRYNGSSHFGGHRISYDQDEMNKLAKFAPNFNLYTSGGIIEDNDFRYGRANVFRRNGRLYTYQRSIDFTPFQRDFIWEAEIKVSARDTTTADGNPKMFWGSYYAWYAGVRAVDATGNNCRYVFYAYNAWFPKALHTVETAPSEVYHRLRITKDYANGIRMWRNFTKDDESQWQLMTVDTTTPTILAVPDLDGKFGAQNYEVGTSASMTRNYYAIGGFTENTSHHYDGKIGYIKLAIGEAQFAYSGLNFDQPEIAGVRNFGTHILAYKKEDSGQNNNAVRTSASMVMLRPYELVDSRVNTNEYCAKFDQLLSEGGRNKTVRIDIEREDLSDPSKVNGYLIEFNRK